jgi:hypothetical protein
MANTYTLIEAKTLGSAVSSVTFSSIPQTYTDLLVKLSIRNSQSTGAWNDCLVTFNGTTHTRTQRRLNSDGSSVGSATDSAINIRVNNAGTTSNTFGNAEMYIPNYRSSNNKSISTDEVTENNATTAWAALVAGLVTTSDAITSMTFTALSDNWVINSTFYLYGIKNS